MNTDPGFEIRRTSPLALWRYSHEYLDTVRQLSGKICVTSAESQVPYHLAAQAIEFGLKAFLRTRGATMADLQADVGHSLQRALDRCEAQGLAQIPPPSRAAIVAVAPFHQDGQFVHLPGDGTSPPDVEGLLGAGVWILDTIAPDVIDHFVRNLGNVATPPADEYVRRLRAALSWTSKVPPAAADELAHFGPKSG